MALSHLEIEKGHRSRQMTIEIKGLSKLCEVLYVKDLKANLLNISQICDDDWVVQLSTKECNIFNKGKWIIGGQRTSNNCYGIGPDIPLKCNTAKLDEVELWHQRLGHLNFKDLF